MGTGRTFRETFEYREYRKWFPLLWILDGISIVTISLHCIMIEKIKKIENIEKREDNCKKKETTRNKMER